MNPQSTVTGWLKLKSGNSNKFATINNANELLVHDGGTASLVTAMGGVGTAGTLLDYADKNFTKLGAIDTKLGGTLSAQIAAGPGTASNDPLHVTFAGTSDQGMHLASGPGALVGTPLFAQVTNFPTGFDIGNGGLGTNANPLVVTGTTFTAPADQGVHLASGAGFALATPSYATLVVAGAAVGAANPLPINMSGTPINAASLGAGGTAGIGWLSQIAYNQTQPQLAAQSGAWTVGINNYPADQGVHLASGAGFALASPSYSVLTLGGALVAAGNALYVQPGTNADFGMHLASGPGTATGNPVFAALAGNPITANNALGAGGSYGIGWLSQIDYNVVGAAINAATMPAGGRGLTGWASALHYHLDSVVKLGATSSLTPTQNATQQAVAVRLTSSIENWELTRTDVLIPINRGQDTTVQWQPVTHGENWIGSTADVVEQLDATNNMIGQIFRPTTTSLASVRLWLSALVPGGTIDDFSTYANSAALQAVWVASDSVNTGVTLDTTTMGSNSMRIAVAGNANSAGDTVTKTFGANQDYTAMTSISVTVRSTNGNNIFSLRLVDAAGVSASAAITPVALNVNETKSLAPANFVNDGASTPNFAQIKKMAIVVNGAGGNGNAIYIDNVIVNSDVGSVDVSLYDFGANPTPGALGALVTLDDGSTKITIQGVGSSAMATDITLNKGLMGKAGLTANNYYAIVLNNKTQAAATWRMHGSLTGNPYASGNAFRSTNNGAALTHDANADVAFNTRTLAPAWVLGKLSGTIDNAAGLSAVNLNLVNLADGKVSRVVARDFRLLSRQEFDSDLAGAVQARSPLSGTAAQYFQIRWSDAAGSTANYGNISFSYFSLPITRNG
jgi:hypothetical protein